MAKSELQIFRVSKTTKIAATGLFAALSVLLTSVSQALGLNFPIVPYLQFDFGEVAILLAFFMFGPLPGVAASVVEFLTLMVTGQNIPYGPLLKLVSVLSSLAGIWLGMAVTKNVMGKGNVKGIMGSGLAFGVLSRVGIMTIANYLLILLVAQYALGGIVGFVSAPFKLIGLTISSSNALSLILEFTALFNCLQLILVYVIAYIFARLPQLKQTTRTSKLVWFEAFANGRKTRNIEINDAKQ